MILRVLCIRKIQEPIESMKEFKFVAPTAFPSLAEYRLGTDSESNESS